MPSDSVPGPSADDQEQTCSALVTDHFFNPRNMGELQVPDGLGRAAIPCGDSMQVYLRIGQDRILEARFMTDGCGPVIACGSMMTELVRMKTVSEAMVLTEDDIISGLDGLPDSESHCATLAVSALRQALIDYLALRREPWKRTYRQVTPFQPGR